VEAFLRGSRRSGASFRGAVEENHGVSLERIAGDFLDFLIGNDPYFRMMTHFMLDGSLSPALVERLNEESRLLIDQFDSLFGRMNSTGDRRLLAHAFFGDREALHAERHIGRLGPRAGRLSVTGGRTQTRFLSSIPFFHKPVDFRQPPRLIVNTVYIQERTAIKRSRRRLP
jgi:hypothetical protein